MLRPALFPARVGVACRQFLFGKPGPLLVVESPDGLLLGQLYLEVANRRLHLLNDTARQLHDEGVPFTTAELARQPMRTFTGALARPEDLPMRISRHEGRPAVAVFWYSCRGSPGLVRQSLCVHGFASGQTLGVLASVCCAPLPPDWQVLAGGADDLARHSTP